MKESESIESIVAEMRRREKSHYYPKVARNIMHKYSDRIEAAWKRERAELVYAYDPTKAGKGRLPDGSAYALEAMRDPVTERHAIGNAAAMREALQKIREKCVIYNNDLAEEIDALCGNALSSPPRNCDVGTPYEQANRMRQFCAKQKRNGIINCGYCPIKHEYQRDCTLSWSQMLYEAEEGGAK